MAREADGERRQPVMADVARLAGVSHQTVSRVLNDHKSVTPMTRQRVETAIQQLGYRRNTAARALVTRSTRTLGVIGVDASYYGPASTLIAIELAARKAGYFVNFVTVSAVDRTNMLQAIDHLMGAGVDGLVAITPVRAAVEALRGVRTAVPLVELEAGDLASDTSVVVDQAGGARSATRHLLELGHGTVHHISGPDGWLEAEGRVRGWRATLEEAGRAAPAVVPGDWSAESGYRAGLELAPLVARREATAFFVANDQMALGLGLALREHGLSVPRDASMVGFDDIPEAAYFAPPLTTLRQDFHAVGQRCIERLLARMAGEQAPDAGPIQTIFQKRESTGPPPS